MPWFPRATTEGASSGDRRSGSDRDADAPPAAVPGDAPPAPPARRAARVVAGFVFVALIATPLAVRQLSSASDRAGGGALSPAESIERHGFALREVSGEVGIDFTHEAPALDPKLEPIMPAVASLGAAVSVVDYDRDGWQDIYVTTSGVGAPNALYRNLGDGRFEDVAARLGVADVNERPTGVSMGAVWGDYDNDGFEDLFLYRWGRADLFHNDDGRGFTRVEAGFPAWVNANTAVWFDYDADGLLDLFIGTFYDESLDLWDLEHTRVMPESFEFAQNGGRNFLFRNLGGGAFEDVTEAVGMTTRRWTLAAATADVDRDGDPDLFVANDYGINELYINEGGERFREVGRESNLARQPKSGMNASFGDVFNRGEWTLFVTNISEPGVLIHGNDLWVPSDPAGDAPAYRNLAGATGVELAGWGFGAQFGDLDNDGWLDLFVTNGYVSGETRESYWYDYSLVAGGNSSIIADARNWPAMQGRSLSGYELDRVFRNDGAGRFVDVTRAVGAANEYDGRAVALADLWNRGALDVLVAYQRGPLLVYRNTADPANHWVAFELEGRRSNRSAIGAEIRLFRPEGQQIRQIEGGAGFSAQNQRRAQFGLGPDARVDSVVVRWPSGVEQTVIAPAVDRVHTVAEPR